MNDASRRFADRYEILDQIAGGSSIVWKARDTKVGRTVAIKTPSDVVVRTPEQLSRFIEEARVLGKLDHPNILEILHFFERGEVDDRCHIVSKWFDTDLAKVVRRTDLSWQTKLPIMAKILSAITYLHQQGLIHRDLKPDNVFLTEDLNDVRVADLGIASAKGAAAHTVRGTFKYMAPPLPNQETSDARLDIYSLGITFFELLAGESHFKEAFSDVYGAGGGSPGDPRWLHWHLDQARCLPPLNSLDPEIPTILSDVVARMAEKDAARRFRDLTEVTAALQPLLGEGHDGGGAQVLDEKDFHVQKKKTKDISKALVVSIGLAIIVLAIVAVFVFTPPDEPSKLAAPTAEHPAMVSTKEASGLAAPAVAPPHKLQTLRALIEKAVAVAVVPDAPQLVGARAVASRSTASDDEASAEVRNLQQAIAQSPRLASLGSSAAEIDRALSWCRESGMTCNPKDFDDEALRSVRLAPFALDNEEVTNGEFAEFVKATAFRTDAERSGSMDEWVGTVSVARQGITWRSLAAADGVASAQFPVRGLSYDDAFQYCQWAGKRLPTDDEWEFAARGAQRDQFIWGNDPDPPPGKWPDRLVKAADAPTNAAGIRGLGGNVWEWTTSNRQGEQGIGVLKGGSWLERDRVHRRLVERRLESRATAQTDDGVRCASSTSSWPENSALSSTPAIK